MPYTCPTCERPNPIVNQCRCDPNNLPTRPRVVRFHDSAYLAERWHPLTGAPEQLRAIAAQAVARKCPVSWADRLGTLWTVEIFATLPEIEQMERAVPLSL